MKVNGKNYTAVWLKGKKVKMVDQLLLPFRFEITESNNWKETAAAIKNMTVRGAGTIGATAAFGMVQAVLEAPEHQFKNFVHNAAKELKQTRPTAHDLFNSVEKMLKEVNESKNLRQAKKKSIAKSQEIFQSYISAGKKTAEFGNRLIEKNSRILTHCNAGWLALVEWGSATAPIYLANRLGKKPFVFVGETRPRIQGGLTSWEMQNEGIEHALIVDSAAGHFLQKREIDLVITGADRIALNGDVANKIGTYEKAVVAKENRVPFYVAAPLSTFDLSIENGKEIPIEERDAKEILYANVEKKGKIEKAKIFSENTEVKNPAFDVTPAKYITGIITPKGILRPKKNEIKKLFKKY